ncbi:hypothetical protein BGW37DRAFT_496777 [Umbelopsis sp. PMI_123]|nr:hypothetical protein BGW37DRAFT_496777 [Umbelopsis sp. PMI_123]
MDIVNVVERSNDREEEEELKQVRKLMERQMEPLLPKSNHTQFNRLLNLGIPGWSQETQTKEVQDTFSASISSEYLYDILEYLQNHMNKCAMDITTEQNKLLLRCKYLDETATIVTKKMAQSLNQATVTAEKIGQVNMLSKQSKSVKANFDTVMRGLREVESKLAERKILDLDSVEESSRWLLLNQVKTHRDDDSEDQIYAKSTDEIEAIADSHFALADAKSEQAGPSTGKASKSSMPVSKASLIPPSYQERPMIVRTNTSRSSLATHQLKELAAVADKQEERFKFARHLTK